MDEDLGIVGFGRCGQLAARVLGDRFHVVAADRRDRSDEAAAIGVDWVSVSEAASAPRVLLAVPIRALPDALDAIGPRLGDGALVLDLGSVKVEPSRWMQKQLPRTARPVGTHPLFGPRQRP